MNLMHAGTSLTVQEDVRIVSREPELFRQGGMMHDSLPNVRHE